MQAVMFAQLGGTRVRSGLSSKYKVTETRGKQLSVVQLGEHTKMEGWQEKIIEAYGFPKGEK